MTTPTRDDARDALRDARKYPRAQLVAMVEKLQRRQSGEADPRVARWQRDELVIALLDLGWRAPGVYVVTSGR